MPYMRVKYEADPYLGTIVSETIPIVKEGPHPGGFHVDLYKTVPVVKESDHPRHPIGDRLQPANIIEAIRDGWTVTIEPYELNRSNCTHPNGFNRSGLMTGQEGKNYRDYYCPICRVSRGVLIENETDIVDHYPTDHKWDLLGDIQ